MVKVVITGGLGYIGTELCKLYSGESRFKDIVVIDNRFVSERVAQLRDWGIEFIHGDIMDEELMERELSDADVVIHLAGVTDVAYTKTESNKELDERITRIGVNGSRNVLKYAQGRIVFPSTHVVYEGFDTVKESITEDEPTKAVLTYSTGKVQTEQDLIASNKDFVVIRLGSVYGLSQDTMRINIMPNLFSKIASQEGTIKLFGGGIQLKSLVNITDVVRCMKMMAERDDVSRQIYHCTNEQMTVKEVAELCKKHQPAVQLTETDDEIPNVGYTLSNKKLLDTGFEFRCDIDTAIGDMIDAWSKKNIEPALEYTHRGEKEFVDARGKISNYELTEPINLIGYIESKEGTVRANHFHPVQEQKCLLISGQYISMYQDLSYPNAPVVSHVVNAGDMAITKPNAAHVMVFTEDSIFLNLVRGEREHENYGVTHTMPFVLVDEDMRKRLLESYKLDCRSCGSTNLKRVVSLGLSPLANNLLESADEKAELYPLEMNYCPECHNCQLSCVVPPGKMFDNYLYVSSTAQSFRDHFKKAADKFVKDFDLTKESLVIDIGSNDGIALKPLQEHGVQVLGVEPAANVVKIATQNGVPTLETYFDDKAVSLIKKEYGKADLILAANVFAHSDKLKEIATGAFELLKEDGAFIVEVQYLVDTMNDLTFDNIYHEHVNYWTVTSMDNFCKNLGLQVVDVEHVDTHGGSIRVYIKREGSSAMPSVQKFLDAEEKAGIKEFSTYQKFAERVEKVKENVNKNIRELSKRGSIVGYASPAKATTSLNYYGVDSALMSCTLEDNALKHNKLIPGVNIPIVGKQDLSQLPNTVLVLAWNFHKEIVQNNQDLVQQGVNFVSIKDLENENFELPRSRQSEPTLGIPE